MLRYSSGLTVTATTPRRTAGDGGRARRKVRGATGGGGGEVPRAVPWGGVTPLVQFAAERVWACLFLVFSGEVHGV